MIMTFDQFVEHWTGRDMADHDRARTTGIEFARACWEEARNQMWKPIETAPMDGTAILAAIPDSDVPHPIRFSGGLWASTWELYIFSGPDAPTHWMPIPEPPKVTANDKY